MHILDDMLFVQALPRKENAMDSFLAYPLEPNSFPGDSDMRTLARFRRTMDPDDQRILDALLASVQHHWPLNTSAAHWTPLDLLLMTMLVEQKKDLLRIEEHIHNFQPSPKEGRN